MATVQRRPATTARRKKAKAKVSGATIKVKGSNGKNSVFTKTACHSTKTAAKSAAENIRKKGNRAVVRAGEGGKVCVFKGPKMSAAGQKIYAQTRRRKRA